MAFKQSSMTESDKIVYAVMQDIPLEPGQMLLLGPRSVQRLTTDGAFKGVLPDMMIFNQEEWKAGTFNTASGRPIHGKAKKATRKGK
jgi:hypothetical protein